MDTQSCLIVYTIANRNAVGTHTGVYSTRTTVPVVRAPLGVLARRPWWSSLGIYGAQERIRTSTPLPALDPESSLAVLPEDAPIRSTAKVASVYAVFG